MLSSTVPWLPNCLEMVKFSCLEVADPSPLVVTTALPTTNTPCGASLDLHVKKMKIIAP